MEPSQPRETTRTPAVRSQRLDAEASLCDAEEQEDDDGEGGEQGEAGGGGEPLDADVLDVGGGDGDDEIGAEGAPGDGDGVIDGSQWRRLRWPSSSSRS